VRLWAYESVHVEVAFLLYAGAGQRSVSVGTSWRWADVLGGGADPVIMEVGTGSLRRERTKGGPPHGASWLRADEFFLRLVRVRSSASAGRLGTSSTECLPILCLHERRW